MQHFMTYEFIYEFMYMKNIVKSYLNSGVSRFQMWHRVPFIFTHQLQHSGAATVGSISCLSWR